MKAIVNTQYKALEGVFDKGDKVEIEIIRYKEDTLLQNEVWAVFNPNNKREYRIVLKPENPAKSTQVVKIYDEVVAPVGSYKGYRIKSKNGEYYDDGCIRNIIGYKSLGDIFERAEA